MYAALSIKIMALPLSAGLMTILLLYFKYLMALYSSLVRFFFLGSLYFCLYKSCSIKEKMDSSWNDPTRLQDDLSLKDLCSKGPPDGMSVSEGS